MKTSSVVYFIAFAIFSSMAFADMITFAGENQKQSSQFETRVKVAGTPDSAPFVGVLPIAISLVPPAQVPLSDWDVFGVRLNVFVGEHRNVAFVDGGVLGNIVNGSLLGVQLAGIYNEVGSSCGAIQVAGFFNHIKHDFCGIQLSLVNRVDGDMQGLQAGLVNLTQDGAGLQFGVFNRAERFSGLQLGVANYAYQLQGLQVGVFNVIEDSSVPFMPVINVAF